MSETEADRVRWRRIIEQEEADVSNDDLVWLLTRQYKPTEIPPCRVCGGELSMASIGGGRSTVWACSGLGENGWLPGRTPADDHYRRSEFEDTRRGGDNLVMELIRRFKP